MDRPFRLVPFPLLILNLPAIIISEHPRHTCSVTRRGGADETGNGLFNHGHWVIGTDFFFWVVHGLMVNMIFDE